MDDSAMICGQRTDLICLSTTASNLIVDYYLVSLPHQWSQISQYFENVLIRPVVENPSEQKNLALRRLLGEKVMSHESDLPPYHFLNLVPQDHSLDHLW